MAGSLHDLQLLLDKAAREIPEQTMNIIQVEGDKFIKKNFQDQGFNDGGLEKWKVRKTTDRKGRDLTRYRTNRRGNVGELTRFGQKDKGRAILTGHATGGDKLRNSFRSKRENLKVIFYTYKGYAKAHNEGTTDLPKRQFMGKSTYLEGKIKDKVKQTLDQLFNTY